MSAARCNMGDGADFPDDRLPLELAHFRNAVESLGVPTTGLDDSTCLRFLRARSMHIHKAATMYAQFHKWRTAFVPLGHIPFEEIASELSGGKVALQGLTRKGNPLSVIFGSKHLPCKHGHDTFKKSVVYILDKILASAPAGVEKLVAIIDAKDVGYKNVDIKAFTTGLQIAQNYYPERLAVLYVVHVPKLFLQVWKIVSRFLDKVTTEKMVFLEEHNMRQVLLAEVDAATLPSMYGGKAELVLLQDAHVPNWPPGAT